MQRRYYFRQSRFHLLPQRGSRFENHHECVKQTFSLVSGYETTERLGQFRRLEVDRVGRNGQRFGRRFERCH